jgi:hypothetical protein
MCTLALSLEAHQSRGLDWTLPTVLAGDMDHIGDLSIVTATEYTDWNERCTEQVIHMFTANKPLDHLNSFKFESDGEIEMRALYSLLSSVTGVRSILMN